MIFRSILFKDDDASVAGTHIAVPDFFADLNLDQVVAAITAGKEEYDLLPLFYIPLREVDGVVFRHEVMQDLEITTLFDDIKAFALTMRAVRAHLAELNKRYYEHQKERWFLDAAGLYCAAVKRLVQDLSAAQLRSRGLLSFRDYVSEYASSDPFIALVTETAQLKRELAAIRYNVLISGPRVEVRHHGDEPDYSVEVQEAFERFQQGAAKEHTFRFDDSPEMDHIEGRILDGVAQLNHDTFAKLGNYRAFHKEFADRAIVTFDREIQFYTGYMDYIATFTKAGLTFCYPRVSASHREVYNYDGFDLALADKLVKDRATPVCNDFYLKGEERIIVVSGPNQGGKTTFARTFGQLHFLASLGLPVPGSRAQLYLPDGVFTHFEKEERMTNLRGKLEDDLVRIHRIVESATRDSVIIINEIFASTSLKDAIFLSKEIARALIELDLLCVWVTFIDEIATLSPKTVSMVSTVVPDNPAQRTFKVVRQPADGFAYAMSIAEKHRLTYAMIRERVGS
jgi:DNA mismatch repair protein MutS